MGVLSGPYRLANPTDESLRAFVSLRAHGDPDAALARLRARLAAEPAGLADHFVLLDESGAVWAACSFNRLPGNQDDAVRIAFLRARADLDDDAASELLDGLGGAARRAGVRPRLVFGTRTARDLGDLPLRRGWRVEDHGVFHSTDLTGRDDLSPDPAKREFGLDLLLSPEFSEFAAPILAADAGLGAVRSPAELHAHFSSYEEARGYFLDEPGVGPVAAGLVGRFRPGAATVTVVGVLPEYRRRGLGARLHRHLMWAARQLAPRYEGGTDHVNGAMRRLFELNGCGPLDERWTITPES